VCLCVCLCACVCPCVCDCEWARVHVSGRACMHDCEWARVHALCDNMTSVLGLVCAHRITCLEVSQSGTSCVSMSVDSEVRVWHEVCFSLFFSLSVCMCVRARSCVRA